MPVQDVVAVAGPSNMDTLEIVEEIVEIEGNKDENTPTTSHEYELNPKPKKKPYKQKFKQEWMKKFDFLEISANNSTSCKVCHTVIKGGVKHFERHMKRTSHIYNNAKAKNKRFLFKK